MGDAGLGKFAPTLYVAVSGGCITTRAAMDRDPDRPVTVDFDTAWPLLRARGASAPFQRFSATCREDREAYSGSFREPMASREALARSVAPFEGARRIPSDVPRRHCDSTCRGQEAEQFLPHLLICCTTFLPALKTSTSFYSIAQSPPSACRHRKH